MAVRNLEYDLVSFIKMYNYNLSFAKVKVDNVISKTVFYEIIRGLTYKEILPKENLFFFEKYKKQKNQSKAEKNEIYKSSKKVKDNSCGIYLIQNTTNGKCYVGSSKNIRQRLFWHYNNLENKKHPNSRLQNSYNKYGKNHFVFIPILNCTVNYNHILEQWVKDRSIFNCVYNIANDCQKSRIGVAISQSQKEQISLKNKGKKWSVQQKENLKKRLNEIKSVNPINFRNNRIKNFKSLSLKGSQNSKSKLTEIERLEIIDLINKKYRNKDIVLKYPKITSGLITEIKSGRTWKHLQSHINIITDK